MYRHFPLVRALQSGASFLGDRLWLVITTSFATALLWSAAKVLEQTAGPVAGLLATLALGLFSLFWFRRATASTAFRVEGPIEASRWHRMTAWAKAAMRSVGVGCLIIASLTVPTVALAYARIVSQSPLPTPADAEAAVNWALPIAAALASPIIIRLYLYLTAIAAGRHDITIADAWRWGRGNSLRIIALLAVPVVPLLMLRQAVGQHAGDLGWVALPETLAGAFMMTLLLALTMSLLARSLSGLVALPVRS